jgi:hypothetical protein
LSTQRRFEPVSFRIDVIPTGCLEKPIFQPYSSPQAKRGRIVQPAPLSLLLPNPAPILNRNDAEEKWGGSSGPDPATAASGRLKSPAAAEIKMKSGSQMKNRVKLHPASSARFHFYRASRIG